MGGMCSPEYAEEESEVNVEDCEGEQTNEKITKLINDYQEENEKLRKELEELKMRGDGTATESEDKAKQNEEVMKELAEMRTMLDNKQKELVRGRLEAALLSKATSMLTSKSGAKVCIEGKLKQYHQFGLITTKKDNWVEVRMSPGEVLENDYKSGYVVLIYSDTKESQTSHRVQVLEITFDEIDTEQLSFTLSVLSEGSTKELVFACETVEQKSAWTKSISVALMEVKSIYDSMHEEFTLSLEFSKEKLGIRVEENFADHIEYDEKTKDEFDSLQGKLRQAARELEIAEKKKLCYPEKVVSDLEKANEEALANDIEEEEEKEQEKPCELTVGSVSDEDLIEAGLVKNCIIRAINDTKLVGMVYSDQLELLMNTPKPFFLTFTGKNFMTKSRGSENVYNSILRELMAEDENAVKNAFEELIEGTPFENELIVSDDKAETIRNLLSDQRRLMSFLQNCAIQDIQF